MARYLLIEFDDDAAADRLRVQIEAQTKAGKRFRVAGMFARPKKTCECPKPAGYHKNQVRPGRRFGWNMCTACKRPVMGAHRSKNLLDAVEVRKMPEPALASGHEYRVDTIGIFEVPVKNIRRD